MAGRLAGKVCLITGTGGSIGRASAEMFVREGARVVGCDINAQAAEACVSAVRAADGKMVSLHPCDPRDPAMCQQLVDFALSQYGQLDVLFNCAADAQFAWLDDLTHQQFADTLEAEVSIVFNLTKAAWAALGNRKNTTVARSGCQIRCSHPAGHSLLQVRSVRAIARMGDGGTLLR